MEVEALLHCVDETGAILRRGREGGRKGGREGR